jgi:hypothetical protein
MMKIAGVAASAAQAERGQSGCDERGGAAFAAPIRA